MDLIDFARNCGLIIDALPPLGVWKRYKTDDHPHKRNGAVKYLGDHAFVQNHATMVEPALWKADKPMPDVDRQAMLRKVAKMQAEDQARRAEAREAMRAYFARLPRLREGHPYLEHKGLSIRGCEGLRMDGDKLVIPVLHGRELLSYQTISPAGEKKFRYLCSVKGGAYRLTRPGATLTCYCEGFATGLAVFQSVPTANVVVCFDAGNLVEVARSDRVRGLTVVCADNDWAVGERTGTNTGVEKGRKAAELIGCGLAYPQDIAGTDWADALQEYGENSAIRVRMQIQRAARMVFAKEVLPAA